MHFLCEGGRMAFWRFMDYHTPEGQAPLKEWYRSQGDAVQARFDFVLRVLEATESIQEWIEKDQFKVLTRKQHIGLCEIRFAIQEHGKARRFRPLGFWYPRRTEFVLISGVEKIGRKYVPSNAFDFALDAQLNFFLKGAGTLYEHSLYTLE